MWCLKIIYHPHRGNSFWPINGTVTFDGHFDAPRLLEEGTMSDEAEPMQVRIQKRLRYNDANF